MDQLFRFPEAASRDPRIELWLSQQAPALGQLGATWFARMRACGPNVRELMHDGNATACVEDAAFAYVGVYKAHINVGFFRGSELDDPSGLLEGTGRHMRHVKVRPGVELDAKALAALIRDAYGDMQMRVAMSREDEPAPTGTPKKRRRPPRRK